MSVILHSELDTLLAEDCLHGDLTTETLALQGIRGRMSFRARGPMVAALVDEAAAIIERQGCRVECAVRSGDMLAAEALILTAQGEAPALLRSWKVSQTLVEVWSGVASAARSIVDAARAVAPDIVIACTRKNVPGTKRYAVAAVKAGGAVMHRLGLSETILLFPEHRVFLEVPLAETARSLRRAAPEKKLVVEINSVAQALEAAAAGFDVIQAEKFQPADIANLREALDGRSSSALIAAAGGINAGNAAAYARAGADILVTSAPYLAPPRDVQVTISRP